MGKSRQKLRPVGEAVSFSGLDLRIARNEVSARRRGVAFDGCLLTLKAKARETLPVGASPVIGDHCTSWLLCNTT